MLSSFIERSSFIPNFPSLSRIEIMKEKGLRRLHERKVRMSRFRYHMLIIELPRT